MHNIETVGGGATPRQMSIAAHCRGVTIFCVALDGKLTWTPTFRLPTIERFAPLQESVMREVGVKVHEQI